MVNSPQLQTLYTLATTPTGSATPNRTKKLNHHYGDERRNAEKQAFNFARLAHATGI